MRSAEGVDCETLSGRDLQLVEDEMRVLCICGKAVVAVFTLDVVFISVAVLVGMFRFSVEICKLDGAENLWVIVVVCNVVDTNCAVFPDWEDDGICKDTEDGDFG